MRIRTELFGTILIMFLFLMAINMSLFYRTYELKHDVTLINVELNNTLSTAIELDLTFHKYKESWKNILLRGHTLGRYQAYLSDFYNNERKLFSELNALKKRLTYAPDVMILIENLYTEIKINGKEYRKSIKLYFDSEGALQDLADKFVEAELSLSSQLEKIRKLVSYSSNKKLDELEVELESKLSSNFILTVILTSVCILLLLYILHSRIITPVEYAISVVKRLKNKEYHVRMAATANNEFGVYASSFNSMMDSLEHQKIQLEATSRQLMEAEKLAALGDLVAGVAHELNTPLGIGLTASTHVNQSSKNLKLLADEGKLTKRKLEQYFDNVLQGTQVIEGNLYKASEIISTFKQVAVDQSSENRREFDIKQCLDENVFNMNLKHKGIAHEINVNSDPIIMDSFPGPLGQVIVNLINNSFIHGFSDGRFGVINIDVKPLKNGWIELVYQDNGKGMPAHIVNKAFEPFFTTALDKSGSGLGMSIVLNIVKKILQGYITLESDIEAGVTIVINIPTVVTNTVDKNNQIQPPLSS